MLEWLRKKSAHLYAMSVILIKLWDDLSYLFCLTYSLSITFLLDYFFNLEFCLAVLLQLFFIKCSNNFFIVKIAITHAHDTVFFIFLSIRLPQTKVDFSPLQKYFCILIYFHVHQLWILNLCRYPKHHGQYTYRNKHQQTSFRLPCNIFCYICLLFYDVPIFRYHNHVPINLIL